MRHTSAVHSKLANFFHPVLFCHGHPITPGMLNRRGAKSAMGEHTTLNVQAGVGPKLILEMGDSTY